MDKAKSEPPQLFGNGKIAKAEIDTNPSKLQNHNRRETGVGKTAFEQGVRRSSRDLTALSRKPSKTKLGHGARKKAGGIGRRPPERTHSALEVAVPRLCAREDQHEAHIDR